MGEQVSEWQLLATAPLVEGYIGEPVAALVYGPTLGVHCGRVVRYSDGHIYAGVPHINGNSADWITHWMPLPERPK